MYGNAVNNSIIHYNPGFMHVDLCTSAVRCDGVGVHGGVQLYTLSVARSYVSYVLLRGHSMIHIHSL